MATGRLTIRFRGICAHFSNIVPTVPHRVVLPRATPLRFGLVDTPEASSTLPYVILPHFAVLRTKSHEALLDVPGVMTAGVIYDGVRLQVANAIGDHVEYVGRYKKDVPKLAQYVPCYQFSDEVVLGGRAALYFDVFSGTVMPYRVPDDKIAGVMMIIETDGPPVLTATPFFQATGLRPTDTPIPLISEEAELIVGNIGIGCGDAGSDGFDFLLNYLTQKGGIPRFVSQQLPGMPAHPEPFYESIEHALKHLAGMHSPFAVDVPDFDIMLFSTTLSCSNTQYP